MVQKSLINSIVGIIVRTILLMFVLIIGAVTSDPAHGLILNTFHFQNPAGFFSASWAEWSLAWVITSAFWGGVVFGAIGKKIDYVFATLLVVFALWEYLFTENVTPVMYLGLIGAVVLGNVIGYILKIGRENWFGKK